MRTKLEKLIEKSKLLLAESPEEVEIESYVTLSPDGTLIPTMRVGTSGKPRSKDTNASSSKISFDGRAGTIFIEGTPCDVNKTTDQYKVARVVFGRRKPGGRVHWHDFVGKLGDAETPALKQSVKDAVRGLNSKIRKVVKVNEDILTWEDGYIVRRM